MNSKEVVLLMKKIFVTQVIFKEVYADNMLFKSHEVGQFARSWNSTIITTSPR